MIKLLSFSLAMFAATFAGKLFAQELPGYQLKSNQLALVSDHVTTAQAAH